MFLNLMSAVRFREEGYWGEMALEIGVPWVDGSITICAPCALDPPRLYDFAVFFAFPPTSI